MPAALWHFRDCDSAARSVLRSGRRSVAPADHEPLNPMHETALAIGGKFFELYGQRPGLVIVDIGSQDVNGTFRSVLPDGADYIGVDMAPGKNVDIVSNGRQLPLPDGAADLTVASSALEHDPLFWMTFLELCRVTKPGGYIYISAPSNGQVHRHPVDCWRFYPDAAPALVDWARQQGIDVSCVESFTAERAGDIWNDFVAVFARGPISLRTESDFVCNHFSCFNVNRFDQPAIVCPNEIPEDARLLAQAIAALVTLETRARAYTSGNDEIRGELHVRQMKRLLGGPASVGVREVGTLSVVPTDLGLFRESFEAIDGVLDMVKLGWGGDLGKLKKQVRRKWAAASGRRPVAEFGTEGLATEAIVPPALPEGEATFELPTTTNLASVAPAGEPVPPVASSHPSTLRGCIDYLGPSRVAGWVWDRDNPDERLTIEVEVAGSLVATVTADQLRPDLETAGIGDGYHSFLIDLPGNGPQRDDCLKCTVVGTDFRIPLAPSAYRGS